MNTKEILERPGSDAVDKKKGICVVVRKMKHNKIYAGSHNLKMSKRFLLNDELRDNG